MFAWHCLYVLACVYEHSLPAWTHSSKTPSHASWGQVRTLRGALSSCRGGPSGRGRPPALLGNSLGLIGAWLVSHVSTYSGRWRIPLYGAAVGPGLSPFIRITTEKRLYQAEHQHDSMTDWGGGGAFHCSEVSRATFYCVWKWYVDPVKPSEYSLFQGLHLHKEKSWTHVLSFCSFLNRSGSGLIKPPLLLYSVSHSSSHAQKPHLTKHERRTCVDFSCPLILAAVQHTRTEECRR